VTVMVDELKPYLYPNQRVPPGYWCHLTCDGDVEELHRFAKRIGCRRSWFQDHPGHPHYDLTSGRRTRALQLGAVFVPAKEQARRRLEVQRG